MVAVRVDFFQSIEDLNVMDPVSLYESTFILPFVTLRSPIETSLGAVARLIFGERED